MLLSPARCDAHTRTPFPLLHSSQVDALVDEFALANQGALLSTLATVYRCPVPAVVGMGVNGWDVERNDWRAPVELRAADADEPDALADGVFLFTVTF